MRIARRTLDSIRVQMVQYQKLRDYSTTIRTYSFTILSLSDYWQFYWQPVGTIFNGSECIGTMAILSYDLGCSDPNSQAERPAWPPCL